MAHRRIRRFAATFIVIGALEIAAARNAPQTPAEPDPLHACRFGPAVNVATLPAPTLMTGIGTSHLAITTTSPRAQKFFDQGLNLMHGFWDTEAYRAFKEAARLDPTAAMPYWGLYTVLGQNAQEMSAERAEALSHAVMHSPQATEHERYYIRAAQALADPAKGRAVYIAEMEAMIDRYPSDIDAQLLLANTLSTPTGSYLPDGRPREGKLYGQSLLKNLLRTHPNHAAVHHYWIHAVENGPRPESALDSARKLPLLAPKAGHMLHMPGHIYYRLGRYAEARQTFLASKAFDERYMARERMSPINHWNYVHNLDYLVATAAEDGGYESGLEYARLLADLPVDPARLKSTGLGYITYGGFTAAARFEMRYGHWQRAADELSRLIDRRRLDDPLAEGYYDGLRSYARGMAAVDAADRAGAERAAAALGARYDALSTEKVQLGADWYFRYAIKILEVNRLELTGAIQSLRGEHDAAAITLKGAMTKEREIGYWEPPHYTRPVAETLGEAARRAGRLDDARAAYRAALKQRPNSVHARRALAAVDRASR